MRWNEICLKEHQKLTIFQKRLGSLDIMLLFDQYLWFFLIKFQETFRIKGERPKNEDRQFVLLSVCPFCCQRRLVSLSGPFEGCARKLLMPINEARYCFFWAAAVCLWCCEQGNSFGDRTRKKKKVERVLAKCCTHRCYAGESGY